MMEIDVSGAALSRITETGEKIRELEKQSGLPYLPLHRGVCMAAPIGLNRVVRQIDFDSPDIRNYPPGPGSPELRRAINDSCFMGKTSSDHIFITAGGMHGLDLIFRTIASTEVLLPRYFWGSYAHILAIQKKIYGFYGSYGELSARAGELAGKAVVLCDPGNPLGDKYPDQQLSALIRRLCAVGAVVVLDAPYRRLMAGPGDGFYAGLCGLDGLVVVDSFSKSLGLSGQRIGFVHCCNEDFNREFAVRLMYSSNGVNGFAQQLVRRLLDTATGRQAAEEFREKTVEAIRRNIRFLRENGFVPPELYRDTVPDGMFVVVGLPEEELLRYRIGSVSLSYFTRFEKETAARYSRICTAYSHEPLKEYFTKIRNR